MRHQRSDVPEPPYILALWACTFLAGLFWLYGQSSGWPTVKPLMRARCKTWILGPWGLETKELSDVEQVELAKFKKRTILVILFCHLVPFGLFFLAARIELGPVS